MSGRLFLVATPIGNLEDITARAIATLNAVSFIACEDTRHSRILLDHWGIRKPTVSLPAFAEGERAGTVLSRVEAGEDCALITDAGSPAVSDPGERLVAEAIERGISVIPIPGATALIAALSASGLPTARFHFLGFLPRTASEADAMLEEVKGLSATVVLYESPRRVAQTLQRLLRIFGNRRGCIGRELTKIHEELVRADLGGLAARYAGEEVRGEVVIVVEGRTESTRWSESEVRSALSTGLAGGEKLKGLSSQLAGASGWSARDVYRLGLSLKLG